MSAPNSRQLVAGMVGGGPGADIGKTHRYAMRLDGHYDLRAGIFGRDRSNSRQVAVELGVAADRNYADVAEMAAAEARRKAAGKPAAVPVAPPSSSDSVSKTAAKSTTESTTSPSRWTGMYSGRT